MRLTTPAFVLRQVRWSDSSLILTLYSLDLGRTSAMAKGALRPGSSFAGQLELFSLVEVGLSRREGRELDTITSASAMEHNQALRSDPLAFGHACLFGEWVLGLMYGNEPSQPVFHLIARTLAGLCVLPDRWAVTCAGVESLVRLAGMGIELRRCTLCGRETGDSARFSARSGGVVCEACGTDVREVPKGVIEYLRKVREGGLEAACRIRLWKGGHRQCHDLLRAFVEAQLQNRLRLRSLDILEDLENDAG
ncbi:DNA repair protein RecO [Candidatus Fermentibacterales bacterium]|nr:DNA repair protein RecO [Candidatus Fermentibacterales bacterium]